MAEKGQPSAMNLMAGQMLNAQQNLEAVREFAKPAAAAEAGLMGLGPMSMGGPLDHGALMMANGMPPPDVHFMPQQAHMPIMPEFMGMPGPAEIHHMHHPEAITGPPIADWESEFEKFQLAGPPPDQQLAHFEMAYQQAVHHHAPPHQMMHHQMQQMHHQPPQEAWANEFHQMQGPNQAPGADFENIYSEMMKGPNSEQWAQEFAPDELEDMEEYFRQAEENLKNGDALEQAFNEAQHVDPRSSDAGVDKAAIDRLMATADPKMRNSQFMQFLSKVSTGEIQFKDNQAVRMPPQASQWADLYADGDEKQGLADWAADYASPEEIAAARQGVPPASSEWAAEYAQGGEDALYHQDDYAEYDSQDEAGFDEDFNYLNWDSLNAAKNAIGKPHSDPVYEFSLNNPYVDRADAFEEAMRLFDAGNLSEATLAFEAVLQQTPDNADCWRLLGQCHAENESEVAAIAALLKAVEFDPYNLEALLLLSVSFTNDLEQSRALNFLKAWLQHHPEYQQIANDEEVKQFEELYGGSSDPESQHTLVTNLFLRASQAMPKDADVAVALGVLYNISSEYDLAIQAFQRAAELKPQDPSIWNKIGATQANSERSNEALSAYKKALELRPNYVRALANLGIAFANQNMHEEAASAYLATLSRNPMAEHVWSYLRLSLASMGRDDLLELAHVKNLNAFRDHFQF